jgi:MoaC family
MLDGLSSNPQIVKPVHRPQPPARLAVPLGQKPDPPTRNCQRSCPWITNPFAQIGLAVCQPGIGLSRCQQGVWQTSQGLCSGHGTLRWCKLRYHCVVTLNHHTLSHTGHLVQNLACVSGQVCGADYLHVDAPSKFTYWYVFYESQAPAAITGVEMGALTAVQVALLTIYDMCKAADRRYGNFRRETAGKAWRQEWEFFCGPSAVNLNLPGNWQTTIHPKPG